MTSTLGKALGGASGGFTTGRKEIVELLRQRSRPVPVLEHARAGRRGREPRGVRLARSRASELRERVHGQRRALPPGHARGRLHDQARACIRSCRSCSATRSSPATWPRRMLDEGIYVIGFSYPGRAEGRGAHPRAAFGDHDFEQVDRAIAAFIRVGAELGVLG